MKNPALLMRLAGVVLVSTSIGLAGELPAALAVPVVKKDSGHAIPAPAAKGTVPNHISPPLPKPGLPVDAGKVRGTAAIGGAASANGHKEGMLNGTQIKRRP